MRQSAFLASLYSLLILFAEFQCLWLYPLPANKSSRDAASRSAPSACDTQGLVIASPRVGYIDSSAASGTPVRVALEPESPAFWVNILDNRQRGQDDAGSDYSILVSSYSGDDPEVCVLTFRLKRFISKTYELPV
jgi:hypothetical protein